MNFLLVIGVAIIELAVIFRIRFVYSRHPVAAIMIAILIILGFVGLSFFIANTLIRAAVLSCATANFLLLLYMFSYMWQLQRDFKMDQAPVKADFLVVLGNKSLNDHVSDILASRLDKAVELYRSLPEKPTIVVSGNRRGDETSSEASLMEKYLLDAGVSAQAIVKEDKSKNTAQNLSFSAIKITQLWHKKTRPQVVVVTSDFHVPRVRSYAKKIGLNFRFVPAVTVKQLKRPSMFREFTAIVWYHRYSLFTMLGIEIVYSLSWCL
ncbi:YdcF family protein [Companilactobacillus sp. FL22-1]|uniref:YdcF family protein n=1 Tax=Companilactobacillus sp. FL22-1 TaxID=3373892 RepID=UPI0037547470